MSYRMVPPADPPACLSLPDSECPAGLFALRSSFDRRFLSEEAFQHKTVYLRKL